MSKVSILLVDDSATARMRLRKSLEDVGYTILEANNGQEGQDIVAKADPKIDLVVTDHNMPIKTGIEMVEGIRGLTDPNKASTPVLALSSESSKEFREKCSALKVKGLLLKPVNVEAFVKAIQKMFPIT